MQRVLRIQSFDRQDAPGSEYVTKFGGQPDWTRPTPWPISPLDGQPLRFVAQIALWTTPFETQQMAYIFFETYDPEQQQYVSDNVAVILQDLADAEPVPVTGASDFSEPDTEGMPRRPVPRAAQATVIPGPSISTAEYRVRTETATEPDWAATEQLYYLADTPNQLSYAEFHATYERPKIGGTPIHPDLDYSSVLDQNEWTMLLQLPVRGTHEGQPYDTPFLLNYGTEGCGYLFLNLRTQEVLFDYFSY